MNDLKTINEVCRILGITSRTVRYYEQCGLIKTIRISKTFRLKIKRNYVLGCTDEEN